MGSIGKIISFLRWRLVLVRKLTMVTNIQRQTFKRAYRSKLPTTSVINNLGYISGPTLRKELVEEICGIYNPRITEVKPKSTGAPFKNLMTEVDLSVDNPILKLAFSKEVLDVAMDYFGGKILFDSIQVLYSYPTHGELRESQMWHKDFGDSKSFHAITYLNDVENLSNGPFVFVDKKSSKKMKRSFFIRRIKDEEMSVELKGGAVEYFYGKAGTTVFVDPASCYHYGSRCEEGRLAIFITFNTSTPYMIMPSLITEHRHKLFAIAKELRPDLSDAILCDMLRVKI